MRRVLGGLLMLAGAYALYWAYKGAGGHMPTDYSLMNPVIQYGGCGALAFVIGYAVFRSYRPPMANTMVCPSCAKILQKGRRNCPFCKEQLIHY
jgi:branched-subunit amino acid ABC-type transport system permease component